MVTSLTFPGHFCCLAVIVLCLFLAMPWVDLRSLTDIFCHSCCLANSVQCLFLTMQLVDLWSVTNIFCVFSSWCRGMIYGLWLTFPGHSCCLAVSVLCLFNTMPWFTYGLCDIPWSYAFGKLLAKRKCVTLRASRIMRSTRHFIILLFLFKKLLRDHTNHYNKWNKSS